MKQQAEEEGGKAVERLGVASSVSENCKKAQSDSVCGELVTSPSPYNVLSSGIDCSGSLSK